LNKHERNYVVQIVTHRNRNCNFVLLDLESSNKRVLHRIEVYLAIMGMRDVADEIGLRGNPEISEVPKI
jgi:hypothetical protein